jgi:Flp pilus assembly protein TadG
MRVLVGRLLPDRRGNFGMILALLMAPLAMAMGVALDFGYALSIRSQIQNAADSAAVGALSEQSAGVIAALSQGLTGELEVAKQDADRLLRANLESKALGYLSDQTIVIERRGLTLTSRVEVTALVPTSFLGMFGRRTTTVSVVAEGSFVPAKYIDFHMMLDNSPSMGLGATTEDINKLIYATRNMSKDANCGFACHVQGSTSDYYTLAKTIGVTTRIQMVAKAAQAMLETAEKNRRYQDQYRMAVYSLGAKAAQAGLTKISDLSSNLDAVRAAAGTIDLMSVPKHESPNMQTDLLGSLTSLKTVIGNSGSGSGSADRQKVLFLVSDGVEDVKRPSGCLKKVITGDSNNNGRCQQPLDTTACQAIKANGVSIAVLYTTYQPLDSNGWYNEYIKPFRPEIGANMKACASDGLYFEVSPSQGIEEAMTALFLKIINMPRLTM